MGAFYNLFKRVVQRVAEIPERGLPALGHRASDFDEEWGTETDDVVWLTNPRSKNFVHGVRYEPCSPVSCRWAIENAGIDFSNFHFVDVGCGKGRPLVIASRYPFSRVVGIEYSARLCEQARRNLVKAGTHTERFEVLCADAADFPFAEHNALVYLHNPFGEKVLQRVMGRLERLAQDHRIVVAYEGPRKEQLAAFPWLSNLASGPNVCLFAAGRESRQRAG